MGSLSSIRSRHGWDRTRDAIFIGGALLCTLLSLGAITTQAQGRFDTHRWTVTVVESPVEVAR